MGHEVPLERVSLGVSHSWNEGCPRVPKSLGHPKSCWAGGSTEMPPEMSPPLPPNSCWLNAAGLLPLNQLPARLAPTHQDAGSPALRSSCPPAPSAPCQLWALGGGGSPVPWSQPGRPRPLRPTERAQDPVLKPSPQGAAHGPRRHRARPGAGDHLESSCCRLRELRWGPGRPPAPDTGLPAFPLPKDLLGHQSPHNS